MVIDDIKEIKIGVDGDIMNFTAANAMQDVRNVNDTLSAEGPDDDFYSNIFGLSKAERERKKIKVQSKADARRDKAAAKLEEAKAKTAAAKAAAKGVKGDIAIANALKSDKPDKPEGMSMTKKIAIGAGVLIIFGVGAFFIFKKKKK